MKPTAKTLIEKHGFQDPDRKSVKHDEIQIWTYENISTVLQKFSSSEKQFEINRRTLEMPIVHETKNYYGIVGYMDLFVTGRIIAPGHPPRELCAAIEVKSSIESCGDLIRQINFYRRFRHHDSTWIVISPDDRFEKVLRAQRIYFFKYKSPGELF